MPTMASAPEYPEQTRPTPGAFGCSFLSVGAPAGQVLGPLSCQSSSSSTHAPSARRHLCQTVDAVSYQESTLSSTADMATD
ncbi:hypothetical protein PF003_g27171 [Phytophthora fragariae]|nr:hypothetical protein PF003_g27171 [Phytophthora fragariae]